MSATAIRVILHIGIQFQVLRQSIQKVGELAEKNPNETVSILRQWLHDTPM